MFGYQTTQIIVRRTVLFQKFISTKGNRLFNNSFKWKNVTFLGAQNILWLLHIFMGSRPPTPRIYTPACAEMKWNK